MKTNLILSALVIGTLVSSCKKEETTPDPVVTVPATVYSLSKDSTSDGDVNNTQIRIFEYNSSKKLVKVKSKYGTSTSYNDFDTVYYNSSSQVSKVENYNTGTTAPQSTSIYNYTAGVLTSINESGTNNTGPYVRTRTFTYSSGKLSAVAVVYTTGSSDGGGPEDITAITFTGNNMTSADVTGLGPVTITNDETAVNPYYGLNFDAEDFINIFNQNNILKAFLTATPTMVLSDNTYTYADGRVATVTDAAQTTPRTTYFTYIVL